MHHPSIGFPGYIVNYGFQSRRPGPMSRGGSGPETEERDPTPGFREGGGRLGAGLRRAWIGYQRRLDEVMADAGFDDRRFPDGRVLRMCSDPAGSTISHLGRQLGITRQGAGKIVAHLCDRGYLEVRPSTTSGREKTVKVTPRALEYLAAQRKAARQIENQLRAELGPESFAALTRLVDALGADGEMRMDDYLRKSRHPDAG